MPRPESAPDTDVVGVVIHVHPDRVVLRFYAIGDVDVARAAIERHIASEVA